MRVQGWMGILHGHDTLLPRTPELVYARAMGMSGGSAGDTAPNPRALKLRPDEAPEKTQTCYSLRDDTVLP